jgi:GNAT superfamily N-acetyltransferase
MAHSDPPLAEESPLTAAELADAEALVREAGWNQTKADWKIFLDFGKVHAIRTSAGRVIATAATLPYGGRFAWISMVLVAKQFQRQGLATRLLRRCVDDLVAAQLVPVLDATPAGREVYRQLGFEDSWSFQRYATAGVSASPASSAPDVTVRAITEAVWPKLCAYDAGIFGADRSHLLSRLYERLPSAALYAERDGRIVGLLLGRDGRAATQLGPLVAEDDDVTIALLAHALANIQGPLFIDIPDAKKSTVAWLADRGCEAQRPLTRMLYKRSASFDDSRRTFAAVGPEFG